MAAGRLDLVVEEWIANVVEHGGAQAHTLITLRLTLAGGLVRLAVSDAGCLFDPLAAVYAGPDPERGGGAGLALIKGHSRIAHYERRAGRNRLVLELSLG